ncbi:hypothetical protein ACIO52_31990 [Nocardia sp. NPDC087230]|uniref:hypothetical protein n=1 Tax=Nocardia sp. NPDC087230 TaxID=3364331 RepID=UPI0037F528FF
MAGQLNAFIDESKRPGKYIICAATIATGDVAATRSVLEALRPRGSRRIHMKSVDKPLPIIDAVAELDAHSHLFVVTKSRSERQARNAALGAAVLTLSELQVTRVRIESCDQDEEDRRIIHEALAGRAEMDYDHELPSSGNPLLWLPDIHAWAWGRGSHFRKKLTHRMTVHYIP